MVERSKPASPNAGLQDWDPDAYSRNAPFVSELGTPVVKLLAPAPGERILDLGCGDGTLAARIAEKGCEVVAVDASAEFVAAAKAKGVDAHVGDGQTLCFENEFDAVFSNAALHWMPRAADVVAGVRRALRPAGRFVAEFGGEGNVAEIVSAIERSLVRRGAAPGLYNPWFFPSTDVYASILECGGFRVEHMESLPRPTALPGDVRGWLQTFAGAFLCGLDEQDRSRAIDEIHHELKPRLSDDAGIWTADYVRLRFRADAR